MESGTDSASSVFMPVAEYSDAFERKILAPLQSAYLYQESKLAFRYKSASLVQNAALSQKYAAFRAKRKQAGYSEDDLEETYGFLLFDDVNKANALGQTGVLTGTGSCSSLGDPLKGVSISMFSDCLGPERWQDGQSGYIAIIRLTTGRVKRVCESRPEDLAAPTVGFDCHVSQHLAAVTTQTSFSLAFERTQCYIYELLDDRSNETAPSPSLTCPFAVVAFSYKKRRALAMKEPDPCGFISYEILRILPVLRLAEGKVKKTNADPNKGLCNVVANHMQTYSVMLNPGPAPSPPLVPAIHDTDDLLSSSKVILASPLQAGSKDQLIGGKTPAKLEISTGDAKTESTAAANNLHVLNKTDDPKVKSKETTNVPAELIVSFTSEQSVTEKSPVRPAKLAMTSTGETKAGVTIATNDLQVLNKTGDPEVKTLQTPDVPAELIVSFTSEKSVTEKSPISPVPTKKPLSAKRRRASDCPEIATLTKRQQRKLLRKHYKSEKEASCETPRLQKLKKPSQDDRLSSQAGQKKAASNIDWEKLTRWVMKGRKVRTITFESVKAKETRPGRRTMHSTVVIDREAPPREKSERCNLKPVRSECGRVLVPHGSRCTAHLPKSFKETANVEHFPTPTMTPDTAGVERRPSMAPEPATCRSKIGTQAASPVHSTVQDAEDGEDPVQPQGVDEHTSPASAKDEPTCILSRRRTTKLDFDENLEDLTAETKPRLKRKRAGTDDITSAADTAANAVEDSTVPPVDSEEMPNRFEQRGLKDTRIRKGMLEAQGEKAQIICRPPSIYPKWNRIKTLRKHLNISREHFKKTWWMHFQRPSRDNETVKDCVGDYSVRKKMPASNPSTDALNLLADLALGANNEQVPSQSDQEVEGAPQLGLRKNDDPNNVPGAGEVSVLHTLLGHPRPTQSSSSLVEGIELVHLLCKEHAYSLPLSASLPPGLPGTPFQVSPLSGSTGLLYWPHAMSGVQTPQASDGLEELNEKKNCQPSDHSRKRMNVFKRYRSFVCKDGSVQVTRHWKEKYDFGRDSRFSSDPKDRTVIRALHGPWDFSVRDTSEDMRLIVHMWIGFFYSRSTARFIDLGSDQNAKPHSDEGICSEAEITTQAQSELKVDQFALPLGAEDTSEPSISNTSERSRTSSLDPESDHLDLCLGNCNRLEVLLSDLQFNSPKASDSPSSPTGLKEKLTFQSYRTTILSAEILNKAHCALHTDAPSLKEDVTCIQGEMAKVSVETENHGIIVGMDHLIDKSHTGEMDLKGGSENADATERIVLLKHGRGSSFTEKELYKEAGNGSPPVRQTDDKESNTFCNINILAKDQPEAEQNESLQLTQDCCQGKNRFVKGSDEKATCISTAEDSRDLSDQPLSIVLDCEASERGHTTEPHREFLENQLPQTLIELQSKTVCQNNAMTDHATSGYTCDSVSKVAITDDASISENISLVNYKMAVFTPQVTGGTESPNKAKGTFPSGGDEKAAAISPVHKQAHLVQHETVQHLGSDLQLVEEGRNKVQESQCGVIIPLRDFSGKSTKPTDTQSQIEEVVHNHTRTGSPKGILELSMSRISALKGSQTSQPDIPGGTDGTISIKAHDKPSAISQNYLIPCEAVNRGTNVELNEEGQNYKLEEICCGMIIPLRVVSGENTPPTGPQYWVKKAVRNQTESEFLIGNRSPKSILEQSPCRVSVVKVGETSQPVIAESPSDYRSSPISLDEKPKGVDCSDAQNDVSSDVSQPLIDTTSSPTDKYSQIEMHAPGPSSNPNATKDKPTQAASKSESLPPDPSDRLVVTMPLKSKPDEDHLDVPTSRMKSWKAHYRFYILVTSEDSFFAETKACLEAAGHTAVQPTQFVIDEKHSSLLIIVRNEDISAHLSEVPHLLELKKSPEVLFAGIDEPHDLVNLTHQELFLSGGFVMFDRPSLESLSLDKMKIFLEVLQELNKTVKWKWLLHCRDSRRFKENARFSAEAEEKKHFLRWSQETGLCAVLPYHECDAKSRDHPDYLACLVHLQVQNIVARFPVFITDRTAAEFEKNGILTATVDSFLMRFST